MQVTGPDLIPVPGGYNSGKATKSGQFKVRLGRKGLFKFQRFVNGGMVEEL